MPGWFEELFGRKNHSANQAKDRLKLVLVNDRTDLTPDELNRMKNELITVISRYIEIDASAINIQVTQEGREQRLVADIPLKPSTRKRARTT